MGGNIVRISIGVVLVLQVVASQYQPSVKQYIIRGPSPQSSQTYSQQPVIIERISGSYGPNGQMIHSGSYEPSGQVIQSSSYDPSGQLIHSSYEPCSSVISSGSLMSSGLYEPNLISSGSLMSTGYDPSTIMTNSLFSTSSCNPNSILSTGSFVPSGSVIPSGSMNSNALYEYIGSSGSVLSNGQTVLSNGQSVSSNGQIVTTNPVSNQFIRSTSVPNSMLSQINVSPGQMTDVSSVLNGLQTLKSISNQGFSEITSLTQPQSESNLKSNLLPQNSKIDSSVLNNLAIALQLLILSNMMNTEESEAGNLENSFFEMIEPLPVKTIPNSNAEGSYEPFYKNEPVHQKQSEPMYPNCNFVGSSGFADTNPVFGPSNTGVFPSTPNHPNSRTKSSALMSPYEALGNTHEPFYGASKYDYMSPFSDNNDLFSMGGDFSF